jgi:protein gp37
VTAIEWTDDTWNVVTGCTKISPGCASCYIERQIPMRVAHRRFAAGEIPVMLHPERLGRVPPGPRVFTCSMGDLFHDDVDFGFLVRVFSVMARRRDRVFQVLTKRPERMSQFMGLWRNTYPEVEPNIWLGVSIENARFTWRADVLREIPAAVRFLSCEPLLGSLYPSAVRVRGARDGAGGPGGDAPRREARAAAPLDLAGIDWVIAGGESGPGFRPLNLDHVRELRDACLAAGPERDYPACCPGTRRPAFFFKQVGGRTPKSGGRMLDGREWSEMPELGLQEVAA